VFLLTVYDFQDGGFFASFYAPVMRFATRSIILTGFFLLKIPTVINLVSNGSTLGFFLGGISLDKLIDVLPPLLIHGIPEITGFIIAAYLVFLGKEKFIENKKFNFNLLLFGILIIFIAAFLETYISPIFI
jgi:stage II sporulation protein M